MLPLLRERRGKPWSPWKKTGNSLFGSSVALNPPSSSHFIHFAFQHLCSLASTRAVLEGTRLFFGAPFHPFSFFPYPPFCSHICYSIPFPSMHVLNINGLYDTHTHIHTLGGSALLHKHFHTEEDTAQMSESALSRIQGSVWTAEGVPWEDPRGARGYATPSKHG